MSLPEVMLWQRLRGSPSGVNFRRQHPIGPYVVDFFCGSARLIVEVDDAVHDLASRADRDLTRLSFLEQNGFRVLRISAANVMRDVDAAAASIVSLAASPLHQPAAGPPPRSGEEQE